MQKKTMFHRRTCACWLFTKSFLRLEITEHFKCTGYCSHPESIRPKSRAFLEFISLLKFISRILMGFKSPLDLFYYYNCSISSYFYKKYSETPYNLHVKRLFCNKIIELILNFQSNVINTKLHQSLI